MMEHFLYRPEETSGEAASIIPLKREWNVLQKLYTLIGELYQMYVILHDK